MTIISTKSKVNYWLQKITVATSLISLLTACLYQPNLSSKAVKSEVKAFAQSSVTNATYTDVQALVNMGMRVINTPGIEKARGYLVEQYREAGYKTEIQTFTYSKFIDNGSNLTVDGTTVTGHAIENSRPGKVQAPLIVVPNVGRKSDFAKVNVKDAIAIVKYGETDIFEKARNAQEKGAIGLIIFNNQPGDLDTALAEKSNIPVLSISSTQGNRLIKLTEKTPLNITLNVNCENQVITGRNIIAHLEGVTQPKIILGGHYDTVPGSPGANDNASGTVAVLAVARKIIGTPLARQTWFVAFDGEEEGLYGSRAFADKASPKLLTGLKAMMNFDMVGVNQKLRIGGTPSLNSFVKATSQVKLVGSGNANDGSDHESFAAKGVPILFFNRGEESNYHTPNDKVVDPRLLNETIKVGLDIVKRIATTY
jgi:aminopeptidase YwaD